MVSFINENIVINYKKPKTINEKSLNILIEFICCLKYEKISKKFLRKTLKDVNPIKNLDNFLSLKISNNNNITYKQIYDIIHNLLNKSINLNKIKFFYSKGYDEKNDNELLKYLKVHNEAELFFRKILSTKYSSFSKTLNKYIDYPKQK